jgi:hypothetical protein
VISSFPFWAIPVALLLFERAYHAHLRRETGKKYFAIFCALLFLAGSGLFFYFDGYKNMEPAFRVLKNTPF